MKRWLALFLFTEMIGTHRLMSFRPLLWPTLVAIPALITLLMLGTWQVNRLQWKTALIEEFQARSTAQAVYPAFDGVPIEFQRVSLDGRFLHDETVYLTGRTYEGNAGFHVITAFEASTGDLFFVNRGWVSEAYREPESRPFSMSEDVFALEGIVRLAQRQGQFVPDNEPERGFWFTMKPDEVGAFLELPAAEQRFYIDAIRQEGEELTLPIAAEIKIEVRNSHLNYAITWYGIALSLIGVYFAYHHSVGRLQFGKKANKDKA